MRPTWISVALLGAVVTASCGDRTPETAQNIAQTEPGSPADVSGQPAPAAPESSATGATAPRQDGSSVVRRDTPPRNGSSASHHATQPAGSTAAPSLGGAASTAPAAPPAPPAPRWREVTLAAGTALPLELMTALSSETAKVEAPVQARVRQAIESDGHVVIPAGTVLNGNVVDVARAGRVQGRSRLAIRFNEAEIDGAREEVRTNPISFEGEATKSEDATKIGAGAVGGAIIGGILGGGGGAAKGAAIGGAAGTGAVLATRGRDVTVGPGTDVAATLASPVTIRVSVR